MTDPASVTCRGDGMGTSSARGTSAGGETPPGRSRAQIRAIRTSNSLSRAFVCHTRAMTARVHRGQSGTTSAGSSPRLRFPISQPTPAAHGSLPTHLRAITEDGFSSPEWGTQERTPSLHGRVSPIPVARGGRTPISTRSCRPTAKPRFSILMNRVFCRLTWFAGWNHSEFDVAGRESPGAVNA